MPLQLNAVLPTLELALEITLSIKGHPAEVAGRLTLESLGTFDRAMMWITLTVDVELLVTGKSSVAGLEAVRALLCDGYVSTLLALGSRAQDVLRLPPREDVGVIRAISGIGRRGLRARCHCLRNAG